MSSTVETNIFSVSVLIPRLCSEKSQYLLGLALAIYPEHFLLTFKSTPAFIDQLKYISSILYYLHSQQWFTLHYFKVCRPQMFWAKTVAFVLLLCATFEIYRLWNIAIWSIAINRGSTYIYDFIQLMTCSTNNDSVKLKSNHSTTVQHNNSIF